MKLKKEFNFVYGVFEENIDKIKDYAPKLKASGDYKDFEKRLTFDCMYAFIGSATMCEWNDKYGCNDGHIYTLGKAVLKELKVI